MPRGATGLAAEVERRFRQFQRGTVRPITWETVRSQARLYAERRAGTLLEWLWRMTRARYDAMVANGALEEDEPIELLDGLLIVREPEGGRHAVIVGRVRRALEAAFGQGCYVREDKPFALDDMSEPEPDVVVVRGPDSRYIDQHPSKQLLIVEVAESSLNRDRTFKARLYARAGVADYWIVNLVDEVLEVYRRPVKAPSRRFGWKYGSVKLLKRGASVTPLAAPRAKIRVADLLP